jgi:hypothetical protein
MDTRRGEGPSASGAACGRPGKTRRAGVKRRLTPYFAVVASYAVTGLGVSLAGRWPQKHHETDGHERQVSHQQRDRHKEHSPPSGGRVKHRRCLDHITTRLGAPMGTSPHTVGPRQPKAGGEPALSARRPVHPLQRHSLTTHAAGAGVRLRADVLDPSPVDPRKTGTKHHLIRDGRGTRLKVSATRATTPTPPAKSQGMGKLCCVGGADLRTAPPLQRAEPARGSPRRTACKLQCRWSSIAHGSSRSKSPSTSQGLSA